MSRLIQLWATVALSAAVGACATNEPPKTGRRDVAITPATAPAACGGNVEDVKIKDITILSATQATIKVQTKVKIVVDKAGANWKIHTNGYVFAPAGVVITMPPGPTESYTNGSDEFGWCFKTTIDWESKYTIYFRATATQNVTWKCDPMIANYGGESVTTVADETVPCEIVKPLVAVQ